MLPEVMPTSVVRVETPDGTAFVSVCEDASETPVRVEIQLGKAGASLAAWASALSATITMALEKGSTLHDIVYALIGISSDRAMLKTAERQEIKSAPDGVAKAIIIYLLSKRRKKVRR